MIVSPLLLELGVHPLVAAATSSLMVILMVQNPNLKPHPTIQLTPRATEDCCFLQPSLLNMRGVQRKHT